MNAKTYKAKTIQDALDQIKRELGSEAVILSTQSILKRRAFGLLQTQNWEVTATNAQKDSETVADKVHIKSAPVSLVEDKPVESEKSPRISARLQHNDTRIEELLEQVNDLKRSVRQIGAAIPGHTPESGSVYAELVSQGVDHEIADDLVTKASKGNTSPTDLRDRVRRGLAELLIIDPPAELIGKSKMVSVFVGPTGAGKTTTIAKLAGHAKVRHGKRVALISTDTYRVGGLDQLARYGDLLGVPVYACADPGTLKEIIGSLNDRDLILIDTPGSSPSDFGRLSKLDAVTSTANARVHLVIAASTRSEDITNIVKKFHRFSPRRVVITKVDETEPKGAFVGDILRNEMPISFLTNGQRVPEDLLLPTGNDLARYLLPADVVEASKIPSVARGLQPTGVFGRAL